MSLTPDVVREDHALETAAERSQEALARHRWHWTLDETNADRVTFTAYAAAVERNIGVISVMANGYAAWQQPDTVGRSLGECIRRANMSAERTAAVEAVAEAAGRSFTAIAVTEQREVRDVVTAARERAEQKGTTVQEEIPRVVEWRAKGRASREAQKERATERSSLQYFAVRGDLAKARRALRSALDEADGVTFDAEELDLLDDAITRTRGLLDLVALRITGATDVDWDAELAKLNGADS